MQKDYTVDFQAMGARIRLRRQELGYTQAQLAACAGISMSFVGHLERAEKIPSIETLAALSASLVTTLDYLILGKKARCETQDCPLYAELKELLNNYE